MITKDIIEKLKENEIDFLKINSFSNLPGIYAIFYTGNNFPLSGTSVNKHDIIYIGKTESSQEKRDAKTHFKSGKTGSSTLRRSIGAILCQTMNLTPIPRNESDYKNNRLSHFKFDDNSEEKITEWMKNNLALSFYEYPKSKLEIEKLESDIISELIPILNISKNPNNPIRKELEELRKNCAKIAYKNISTNNKVTENKSKKIILPESTSQNILIDNITEKDSQKNQIRILSSNPLCILNDANFNIIDISIKNKFVDVLNSC